MRVTENRLLHISTMAARKAQSRAAEAAESLTDGRRVRRASDDPAAFARGAKAAARARISDARGRAMERGRDRLTGTDAALDEVSGYLREAYETALRMAGDDVPADVRAASEQRVLDLKAAAIQAANGVGFDDDALLAGSSVAGPAFDQDGAYLGDAVALHIDSAPVGLTGLDLGATPFAAFDTLAAGLASDSDGDIAQSITDLRAQIDTLADARTHLGFAMERLDEMEDARATLRENLEGVRSRAVDADPIAEAEKFASAQTSLESARAVTEAILTMLRQF